ncbi:copper chaperone PCu(A)C [Sphaerisporangium sp. TRM90804]|uniref:copper chaperone PCu(A)C n=1 Tax=Sphaerisporangium sp. TRM90804 TaxID=3031113 RepID=UPI00244D59E5|nr:copper chaperone PCu(A)C [Sphaerisporangium sp. TRM90804]MDH2426987.1 copper chaperone PCu(A)C [Sphaerisporangium sp. TRM90804]
MTSTSRRRVILVTALLAAAPALAACGAGADANTSNAYAPTEASVLIASDDSGKTYGSKGIKIPQAFLLGPEPGAQIAVGGSLPLFMTMVNYGGRPETLSGIAVADQSVTSVRTPGSITLPPGRLVNTGRPVSQFVVEGAKKPFSGGETVALVLRFANAGDVRLTVPVITRSREFASLAPAAPAASPSTSPTPASPASPAAPETTASPSATPSG